MRLARTLQLLTLLLTTALADRAHAFLGPAVPQFQVAFGGRGTAPSQMRQPAGVACDGLGNVYVVELINHRVQKFDHAGQLLQVIGSPGTADGQFASPCGIAVAPNGDLYVADAGNRRIQRFSSAGTFLGKWGSPGTGPGQFLSPIGIATDRSGNVYVTDSDANRVQKFSATGTFLGQFGSLGSADGQFLNPAGIAVTDLGYIYVADRGNHRFQWFASNFAFFGKFGAFGTGPGQFQDPSGIALDRTGNVYVSERGNHRIQMIPANNSAARPWGGYGTADGAFNSPLGLAVEANGDVIVADTWNDRVQRFNGSYRPIGEGGPSMIWGLLSGSAPHDVAVDRNGNVFVISSSDHAVRKFDLHGTPLGEWGGYGSGNGQFNGPAGISVDSSGTVYVADTYNSRVQVFSNSGAYLRQWGTPGTGPGQFAQPTGIAVDTYGFVYTCDQVQNRVQKFSTAGAFVRAWGATGSGAGQFDRPQDVTVDRWGNVYVADAYNLRVQSFSADGAFIRAISAPANFLPGPITGVAIAPDGTLYCGRNGTESLLQFTTSGTYLSKCTNLYTSVGGLSFDPSGNLLAVDAAGQGVWTLLLPPRIEIVSDVRGDAGLQVNLRVRRSTAESIAPLTYEVWRRDSPAAPDLRVLTFPSSNQPVYDVAVPTTMNATASAIQYNTFYVRAVLAAHFHEYDSGAQDGYSIDNRTGRPRFSALQPETEEAPSRERVAFALDGAWPNPGRAGRLPVRFALPDAAPATLELFDLAGRRLARHDVGSLGAGEHVVDAAGDQRLAPGMYLVRLERRGEQRTARAVMAR